MIMKLKNIIIILLAALVLLSSCEKWLDVQPKTKVESSDLFQSEIGYKDALWGVYTLMTGTSMYGLNMTVYLDALARLYSSSGSMGAAWQLHNYNYAGSDAQAAIGNMWSATYNTIANINNLVANIEGTDKSMFSQDNYNVIYGEALALRAFLHFDMLRLFAPSYVVNPAALSIPYVKEFNYNITPQSTVEEALTKVLADLEAAAALLKQSDPIYTGRVITTTTDNGYLLNRQLRMNYFAVKAILARAYMWKGDKTNAYTCAMEVINSGKFKWTSVDNIATTNEQRDRTFTPEQVFALYIENMASNIQYNLSLDARWSSRYMRVNKTYFTRVYPYATDWRGVNTLYFWSDIVTGSYSSERVSTKLWQFSTMPVAHKRRMPLIRLPEMYLIAAECRSNEAIGIINTIRQNRGISEVFSPTSTETQITNEIKQEYLREFYCEGVAWYYYKRTDATTLDGYSSFNKANYVLPIPPQEVEFGSRK
jgi:starch-binding outer membrane protein, SusD/RagB family